MCISFLAEKDFCIGSQQQTSPTIPRIAESLVRISWISDVVLVGQCQWFCKFLVSAQIHYNQVKSSHLHLYSAYIGASSLAKRNQHDVI